MHVCTCLWMQFMINVPLLERILKAIHPSVPAQKFLLSFAAIIDSRKTLLPSPSCTSELRRREYQERHKRSRADQTSTRHAAEVGSQGDGNLWSVENICIMHDSISKPCRFVHYCLNHRYCAITFN